MKLRATCYVAGILFLLVAITNKASAQAGVGISYSYDTSGTSFTLPTINAVSDLSSTQAGLTYWNSANDTTSIVFDSTNTKLGSPAGNHYHGFTYGGILYRGFYVSTNGFIGLTNLANGSTPWTNGLYSLKNNSLATTAGPILAPLWDDLLAGTAYQAKWDTTTAGGPFLWIRFVNMKWSQPGGPNITFWIRLTPASQKIDFIYPANAITPTTPSASIGITGPCAGDYYSVKSTSVSLAGVDSLGENCFCSTSIVPGSGAFRMISFTPRTAPPYDNCANAKVLPNISTVCTYDTLSNTHATISASGPISCSPGGTDQKDIWVKFTKPAGISSFNFNTVAAPCQSVAGTSVEIDTGTCASLITVNCTTLNSGASLSGLDACISQTYYARITTDGDVIGKFKVCVQDLSTVGATCANANPICGIPYNSSSLNTSGSANDYTELNTPCASNYHKGNDYVFTYTPSVSECDSISITGTGVNSYPGIFVYDACPDVATHCIASAGTVSNTAVINKVTLTGGTTYYFVVDNNSTSAGSPNIPFVLHVYNTGTVPTNDDCAGLPAAYDFGNINPAENCAAHTKTGSNECSTPSVGSTDPSCGGFVAGVSGDVWYKFTSQITGNIQINLSAGATNPISAAGFAVYSVSCAGALLDCQGTPLPLSSTIAATAGTVYYIRIWSPNAGQSGNFNLCVFDPSGVNCASSVVISAIPFSRTGLNTGGFINDYDSSSTPCHSQWSKGNDFVFSYTTGGSAQCVQIAVTATGTNSYPGVFLYDGCPDLGTTHCVASATGTLSSSTSATINKVTLNASTTYYIVVDNNSVLAAGSSIPFNINVTANGSAPGNDNCASAISLGTVNVNDLCSAHSNSTGTTECASYSAANFTPACAGFTSGVTGDVWFKFVAGSATSAGVVLIPSGATPIQSAGMAVYVTAGAGCAAFGTQPVPCTGPASSLVVSNIALTPGFTYWIRVWSPDPSQAGTFTLCVSDNCFVNDEPCGAIALPTPTITCTPQSFSTSCATQSAGPPGPTCVPTTLKNDIWLQVTIPATGTYVFQTGSNGGMTDPIMQLYTSATNNCNSLSTLTCQDDSHLSPCTLCPIITQPGLTAGQVVWIRIWPYNTTYGTFTICVYAVCLTGIAPPAGDDPCTVPTTTLPVTSCGYINLDTRCGSNTASPAASCAGGSGGKNDIWLRTVVPASGQLEFLTQAGTVTDWAMAAYKTVGCATLTEVACNDDFGGSLLPYIFLTSPTVVPGDTIYIRIFPYGIGSGPTGTLGLCIHDPCPGGAPPSNDNACGAFALVVDTVCNFTGPYNNLCASISAAPAPGCAGTVFRDVWFKVKVPASGRVDIDSRSGSMLDGGMAAYSTSPASTCGGAMTLLGCDDNNSSNPNMPHLSVTATPGDTIYVRFWDKGGLGAGTFDLCATNPCPTGTQPNDQPCSAVAMSIGVYYTGNNACTNNTAEPIAFPANAFTPACWTNASAAQLNTVWYSFVAPSNSVIVKTVTGSLSNTQIAIYGGVCGAPTLIAGSNCNDDFSNCGGTPKSSQITASVTAGTTYFVVVDGFQGLTGSFSIIVLDATQPIPPQPIQDCVLPASICSQVTSVVNPGYLGYGNICDLSVAGGYGCFPTGGESNSSFYTFNIGAAGTLQFDITPTSNSTNYDWILWKIGTAANPVSSMTPVCSLLTIRATGAGGLPSIVSSNTSLTTGTTGMRSSGTSNCVNSGGANAFNVPIAVATGETYLLMINNSSGTNVGFSLDLTAASPIAYAAPTSLSWSNPTTTSWTNTTNWGPCSLIPGCSISAYINNHPNYPAQSWSQPTISTNPQSANDVLIATNAKLSIGADTLYVCGNFTQNGGLTATANSVICFSGAGASPQIISGNLTGLNKFANVVINKPSGSGPVQLNSDIEVGGNFTIIGNTSVFNINGKNMKVAKNFTNANGKNTFTGYRFSSVEFNGSTAQTFTNGGDTTYFDRVTMNQTGTRTLTLSGANSSMYIDSLLTLTSGKIIATALPSLEVVLSKNNGLNNPAVTSGNANSYVEGPLRRRVYRGAFSVIAPMSQDYPVGNASKGYQLANIEWQQSTQIPYIKVSFASWASAPPFGPTASPECVFEVYDTTELLDNGYWTFIRSSALTGGQARISLSSTNVTNSGGMSAFTPTYSDTASDPNLSASWHMNGVCVYPGTTFVPAERDSMNKSASAPFNFRLATAQGTSPFPITLLYFTAAPEKDGVMCKWETASEINNHYFLVERSSDARSFESIGRVEGAGTSTQPLFYSLFDRNPPCVEVLYYRLKQVDFDGHFSYSDAVAVNCHNKDIISLYPNPANTEVNVNFYQPFDGTITVRIVDIIGKKVSETIYDVRNGYNVINMNIHDLPQGVYYVKLIDSSSDESSSKLAKFLKY